MTVDVTILIKFDQILEITLVESFVADLELSNDGEISIPGIGSRVRTGYLYTKLIIVWLSRCSGRVDPPSIILIIGICETPFKCHLVGLADVACLPAGSSVEPDDTVMHLLPIRISLCVVADDVATNLSCSISIIPGLLRIVSLLLREEASIVS